ncbi:MAG: chemotaxis protein CheW [Magnetococcales bacterium]|nr:chemotaxis protein CheW [Magnetococcales bacterium]
MIPPKILTSYVTLGVGTDRFAVEVGMVREILDNRPIIPLPNAPSFLCGVIDVRGCTVPVIDLREKLGLSPITLTEDTRILVLDVTIQDRTLVIGMRVDRVLEVAEFATESLIATPEIGVRWKSEYIKAIGRLRGEFVIIFNMQHMFGTYDLACLQVP